MYDRGSRQEHPRGPTAPPWRPRKRTLVAQIWLLALVLLSLIGCAKYNTYFNARRSFEAAEQVREEAIKKHQDPPTPAGAQRADYEAAIKKAQKILDEYPGHSLTDDALFLQAKAHHRLEAYRQSIRKLNLLFQNFPATEYMEEALYIQALNFLLIGAVDTSQEYLDRLATSFPQSDYRAETRRVSGDNAFALRRWEEAAESYRDYLALEDDSEEGDRVGLKLAECYWELEDYYAAAEVLQDVSQNTSSAEIGFRSRLLRGRVHVRMADYEIVDLLVGQLRDEAEIYQAQGEVALLEAEALIAQGRPDDAAPLLENMPSTWETPPVKARAAEILGYVLLDRGEWEQARTKFQAALLRKDVLDDEDRVRQLSDNLKDYLAAEQALPDAKGERVSRLKLLKANSLLFGFDRPHMAATLYVDAASDTAADTTVAARALYGAYITYRNYLDEPDSADSYRSELTRRFPGSAQAYEAAADSSSDLFGYLLALRTAKQERNFANLSEEERLALTELGDFGGAGVVAGDRPLQGVRRRKIYLARRENLLFQPPERAVEAIAARQAEEVLLEAADAAQQATFDSLQVEGVLAVPDSVAAAPGIDPLTGLPVGTAVGEAAGEQATDAEVADQEEKKKKEEEKKRKQDEDWDFLR